MVLSNVGISMSSSIESMVHNYCLCLVSFWWRLIFESIGRQLAGCNMLQPSNCVAVLQRFSSLTASFCWEDCCGAIFWNLARMFSLIAISWQWQCGLLSISRIQDYHKLPHLFAVYVIVFYLQKHWRCLFTCDAESTCQRRQRKTSVQSGPSGIVQERAEKELTRRVMKVEDGGPLSVVKDTVIKEDWLRRLILASCHQHCITITGCKLPQPVVPGRVLQYAPVSRKTNHWKHFTGPSLRSWQWIEH